MLKKTIMKETDNLSLLKYYNYRLIAYTALDRFSPRHKNQHQSCD